MFKDDLGRKLCAAAREVLGFAVDSTSSLSACGMDSLMSIQYASTLRSFGLHVSAIDILTSRTLFNLHAGYRSGKIQWTRR